MLLDPAPPPVAAPPARPAATFGFEDASLGETLADWRRGAERAGSCQPVKGALSATICAARPVRLGGHQIAHGITYEFVGGRLARIRFLTSIDAYDRVRARLDGRFGPPVSIVRDAIKIDQSFETPHLKAYWRNGRSTILLNDPERDGRSISVTYSLDALSSELPNTPS